MNSTHTLPIFQRLQGRASASSPAQTYGFQITFFRSRVDVAAHSASRFATRQLIFAHAAVTDLQRGELLHDQRIARAGFGVAQAVVPADQIIATAKAWVKANPNGGVQPWDTKNFKMPGGPATALNPAFAQVFVGGTAMTHVNAGDNMNVKLAMKMAASKDLQVRTVVANDDVASAPKADIAKRVMSALERVSLSDKAEQYPGDLSTGQQQRVGIARAVVHQPALLLADEPTGNLDPRLAAEIMGVFEDINRLGTSVLIASHDLALIARMRHRMLTLQRGRLIGDGEAS